jgi:hypothetical protein
MIAKESCATVPQFDRLRYFYGQMLHAQDLQQEQAYFREKLKLHNRCLHGWGVVCGLQVTPPPRDPDCEPATDEQYARLKALLEERQRALAAAEEQERVVKRAEVEEIKRRLEALGPPSDCRPADFRTTVQIACGLAIDCEGNEVVVRQPLVVDLWSALTPEDRRMADPNDGGTTLYLGLCYRECPIEPVRPVVPDSCGVTSDCTFGKLRDSISVVVTTDADRWKDERCEPCCEGLSGCACCVLLAKIDGFQRGQPLPPEQIHAEVRREIAVRPSTRVSGINWVQGGVYTPSQANTLLGSYKSGNGGLEIHFSRPIRTETVVEGVIDLWVIEGGSGRSANIYHKAGALVLPNTATTEKIVYRDTTDESVSNGDRLLVTLRSAFLLDECCRPLDGAHVGGRVPLLSGSPEATPGPGPARSLCLTPPGGAGPWTSGAGGATNFESWFWIKRS